MIPRAFEWARAWLALQQAIDEKKWTAAEIVELAERFAPRAVAKYERAAALAHLVSRLLAHEVGPEQLQRMAVAVANGDPEIP